MIGPPQRVVVTGMGVVSPLGNAVDTFVEGLLAGRSGVRTITVFDPATLPTRIAGQAQLPDEVPFGDRKIAFAMEAARQAMAQAGLADGSAQTGLTEGPRAGEGEGQGKPRRGLVSMGVGLELFSMEDLAASRAPGFVMPEQLNARLSFMQTPSDLCVHLLSRRYGLSLPPMVHVSACAAGTDAIGAGYRAIHRGRADWALVGGSDSMVNPLGVAGFCALNATSTRNDEPQTASRPFDRTRDGFVMGEGAGVMVLERYDQAMARGAEILGEVAGYGNSLDAYKISDPHPEGRGAWQAMSRALADAGITAGDVHAINAHGTGTPKNDPVETRALRRLLGERAARVPISATKSMIGHCISAAGALEAIAAVACMQRGVVHPTINLHEPDPECDLDFVPGEARDHRQRFVLSSSYGFGGHNAAVVLARG